MDALLRYALLNISLTLLGFELILIFVCLVATVFFKILYRSKRRWNQHVMQELSDLIIKALGKEPIMNSLQMQSELSQSTKPQNAPTCNIDIPTELQGFGHLVETLENFDQRIIDIKWQELKRNILDRYLRKQAKKYAVNRSWLKRQLAARAFIMDPSKENEPYLAVLLHDPKFLVRVAAAIAITQGTNRELFFKVIEQMSKETSLSRFSYRDAILKGNAEKFIWIEELLKSATDPSVQAICLDLLSTRTTPNLFHLILPFIYGENNECRLLAIKILKQIPDNDSHSVLMYLLTNKDWKIRAETLKDLDLTVVRKGISKIEDLLRDPNWFVRLQAALAIKKLGAQGLQILSSQNPSNEPAAYEISQYVIALPD